MRKNWFMVGVGIVAALVLAIPVIPATAQEQARTVLSAAQIQAQANRQNNQIIDDTSVDGIDQVAKTHEPQTDEQSFSLANTGIAPYSLDENEGDNTDNTDNTDNAVQQRSVVASADLSGLATVGVTWTQQDMTNPDNAPAYRLRYFQNNAWSDWVELPSVDEDAATMGMSPSYYVGSAIKVEAELTPVAGQTITDAKLVTIDSGYSAAGNVQGSEYRSSANQQSKNSAQQLAVANSDPKTKVQTAAAVTATGTIHTREEWWVNGNPAMDWPPERVAHWKGAIVHHTVDRNNYSQAEVPAMINGIYIYHNTHNGWGDVGYQMLVDRFGGIWEGRDEGVPNRIVPASQVVGAQAKGFNYDTFGVALLGSYHQNVAPTDAQINSVAAAIAWEFDALGINDPYGTFQFEGTQPRITGHGDSSHWVGGSVNHTQCPGQQVWNKMDTIRARVKSYLSNPASMPKVNLANGTYYINSVAKDSSSIQIAEGAMNDGAQTQLYAATGKANQQFVFTKQSDGSFEIKNVATGKVLDVENGAMADGTAVRQWTANGSAAQHWFVRDSGSGYYLQSALGSYVLDLANGATNNGTIARLYSANASSAQKFGLSSVDVSIPANKHVRIESAAKIGMVLDIANSSTTNSAAVQLYSWNKSDAQLYMFKQIGNNVFTITNAASGKLIEAASGGTNNGTKLQQYADNGTPSQHWMVRTVDIDERLCFFGVLSGKSMDLPNGGTAVGTRVQLYEGNGSVAQQWRLAVQASERERLDSVALQHKDDLPDGTYKVSLSANNSMVLDVANGSRTNGANIQLYSWNSTDAQIWHVSHDDKGYVTLTNVNSGKVLDLRGGATNTSTNIQQYTSNGSWAQKWIAEKNSDGSLTLQSSAKENRVIDVASGSTKNGANVQLYSDNGSAAQKWKFSAAKTTRDRLNALAAAHKDDVEDGTFTFASSAKDTMVMDVSGGSSANGANVQLYVGNGTNAQRWRISHDKSGYVVLTNVGSGKVLDVYGGSTANGVNIQQYVLNGSWAQKWIAIKNGDGTVTLHSGAAEGFVVDVVNGLAVNSANVQLYTGNSTKAQKWVVK